MKRVGVTVLQPSINKSRPSFSVDAQEGALLAVPHAFAGLKNVGDEAMPAPVD